jgi:hypothetical protein
VSISQSGIALPLQIIMEGKDPKRSLPKPNAPLMEEANRRGFRWDLNPKTYWSDQNTMRLYISKILVPFFDAEKARLHLLPDHPAIAQLDVWSVHNSEEFRDWVRDTYPWLELHYIPGGLTGLFQACDVGIQRPFKQAIKRAQLADIVASTVEHLRTHEGDPAALQLDKTIGLLRAQCVRWFVQAFDTIQNSALIKRAFERCGVPGKWSLSWEFLTGAEAIGALLDVQENEPDFWEELQRPRWSNLVSEVALGSDIDESPFADDADADMDDDTEHPSVLVNQLLAHRSNDSAAAPTAEPLADSLDVDLDNIVIPPLPATISGRRERKPNRLYAMDQYDYNPDSAEEEAHAQTTKRKPKRGKK